MSAILRSCFPSHVEERGMYLWRERTRFPPSEMPHGSVAEDTLTESRADLSPKRKCACSGGDGRGGGGLIGEDAAHPRTLPFMHIISFS